MTFDNVVLVLVGLACAGYLANKVRNVMKGESGCSSCSGCSSAKGGSCCGQAVQPTEPGQKR